MLKPERTAAILVAAGRGLRAGAGGPKQYRSIGGKTVIFRAMEAFCSHPQVFAVQPVLNPDDAAAFNAAVHALRYEPPANGGATRQASVHAGLEALASQKPDVVLIHDAARPFVSAALISRAIEAASRTGAAVPAIQVTDTIKQVGETGNVEATPERARLRVAQTPQAFRFDVILDAHRRAARDGRSDFTDDAALAEWAGLTVATFEGDPANMKLTTPEDFIREEARLGAMLGDIRTGTGYDVHAFGDGDHLMLCGVRVPHTKGFLAHSASAASSVKLLRPSRAARRWASRITSNRNACGVCAMRSRARSGVASTFPFPPISLMVSVTGIAGTAAPVRPAASIAREISAAETNGRAASWMRTTSGF